jgi:hypothetical protein
VTTPSHTHNDPWTAFGVGVLGGVIGGLSLISFAGIFAVALIAIFGGIGLRPRPFGAAGVLMGWGASWVILLAGALARCDPASCVAPDLAPWAAFATGLAGAGGALIVIGLRQPGWARRVASTGGDWLRWQPVRIAAAVLLGAISGLYASALFLFGWITAALIWLWFAWRHRSPDRRGEIAWLALAAIVTFLLLVPR